VTANETAEEPKDDSKERAHRATTLGIKRLPSPKVKDKRKKLIQSSSADFLAVKKLKGVDEVKRLRTVVKSEKSSVMSTPRNLHRSRNNMPAQPPTHAIVTVDFTKPFRTPMYKFLIRKKEDEMLVRRRREVKIIKKCFIYAAVKALKMILHNRAFVKNVSGHFRAKVLEE